MKFWVKNFSVNFVQVLPDSLSDIYTSVSEDDSSSEYSSNSGDVNIRPTKRQKALEIHFDKESENETHGAGEDFTGVSGVTVEWNNPQNVMIQQN